MKKKPGSKGGFQLSPPHESQGKILQPTKVYLMTNFPYFMLNKFGISNRPKLRRAQVDKTTEGIVRTILALEISYGYWGEQLIHWLYHFQNVEMSRNASGRKEWFLVFNPVVGGLTWWLNYRFALTIPIEYRLLAFFVPFIWLDGLLWLLIFKVIRAAIFLTIALTFIFLVAKM